MQSFFCVWGGWISCAYSTVNSFYRFGVVLFDLCIIFAIEKNRNSLTNKNIKIMDKYVCTPCGWEYDPAIGDPENGIEPGTAFESLPDDWTCPLCGAGKEDFEKI